MDLAKLRGVKDSSTARAAVRLSALWGDSLAINAAWQAFESAKQPEDQLSWLPILARAAPERLAHEAPALLARTDQEAFVTAVLQALSAIDNPVVGKTVLTAYAKLPAAAKPKAIELLTQRAAWSKDLLTAVREERIPRNDIGASALLRLAAQPDAELKTLVEKTFGAIRTDRNPARQQVIEKIRQLTSSKSGDHVAGRQVFTRVCGQCHQMHGEGHQVGPDITRNGRGNYDQLLSNVLDPNLVIGQGYQTRTVLTTDGRVLTGLLVENNEQRIVLNVQGGKRESIPRDQIEEDRESKLSLMPEALEEQLKEQELLDLFAYLTIETPPGTTPVTRLPGTPAKLHK